MRRAPPETLKGLHITLIFSCKNFFAALPAGEKGKIRMMCFFSEFGGIVGLGTVGVEMGRCQGRFMFFQPGPRLLNVKESIP